MKIYHKGQTFRIYSRFKILKGLIFFLFYKEAVEAFRFYTDNFLRQNPTMILRKINLNSILKDFQMNKNIKINF